MSPLIETAEALRSAVQAAISQVVTRRYVPYYQSNDVIEAKRFVLLSREEVETARSTDRTTLTLGLVYQIALPKSTTANGNPLDNVEWLDQQMEEVEELRALFREGGSLLRAELAGGKASFKQFQTHEPYRPDMLMENNIFTSVTLLDFHYQNSQG
jgi:hypothetical protein